MQAFNITLFVSVFVFHAIWVRLHPDFNTHALGLCLIFSGKKAPPPPESEGARTPMGMWDTDLQHACDPACLFYQYTWAKSNKLWWQRLSELNGFCFTNREKSRVIEAPFSRFVKRTAKRSLDGIWRHFFGGWCIYENFRSRLPRSWKQTHDLPALVRCCSHWAIHGKLCCVLVHDMLLSQWT